MKPHVPAIPGRERRCVDSMGFELRVKPMASGPGKLAGHAAVFNAVADIGGRFHERVARGAFKDSIRNDDIRALWNHDPNHVLGRRKAGTLALREDDKGLAVEIHLPDTSMGRSLAESIRRGDVSQMSFGFDCQDEDWGNDGAGNRVRTLKRVKLYDVSPVTFPAYPQTSIALRWATVGAHPETRNPSILRMRLDLLAAE